jgi:hypothetical protein
MGQVRQARARLALAIREARLALAEQAKARAEELLEREAEARAEVARVEELLEREASTE